MIVKISKKYNTWWVECFENSREVRARCFATLFFAKRYARKISKHKSYSDYRKRRPHRNGKILFKNGREAVEETII